MPRYLITVTDENAAALEAMRGSALRIGPAWEDTFQGVLIAELDAVTDGEAALISSRLRGGSGASGGMILVSSARLCGANARRGTGTGICDRPLDELGQCDRASNHIG
jgi:hypothetical protein